MGCADSRFRVFQFPHCAAVSKRVFYTKSMKKEHFFEYLDG